MKKVIIVGAGISGLTAGIYALESGFDTTIYESHSIPGGASTSWRRKGYLFEGGMHWLTGSSKKTCLNKVWQEVGALNDTTPIYHRDPFFSLEYQGKTVHLYRDPERLKKHFLGISPQDEREINQLCADIKKFTKVDMPITDIKGLKVRKKSNLTMKKMIGMIPAFTRISFYMNQSIEEYAARFQNPYIRHLIEHSIGSDYSAAALIFTLATLASGDGGYPEGGSLAMADRIAKRFIELGGKIEYKKRVQKVVVSNGKAAGVQLDGVQIKADAVIVTVDTLAAIDTLFETPIHEPWAEEMRQKTIPVLNTFLSLGVETELSDLPENITFLLEEPFVYGGMQTKAISINCYPAKRGYAPEGCTAITSILLGDTYAYWKSCKEAGTYQEEKEKLAQEFIRQLEKKYPQIEGKITVWDVATPLTYERYLGSYKGSWMSIMKKGTAMKGYPTKPEKIENVYFAGQRLMSPGGLPAAVETGRKAAQFLCKDQQVVFQGKL